MNWDETFGQYKTEKLTLHSYGPVYDEVFCDIRQKAKSFLEIGVLKGQSLLAWRDYFPNASITGIDNDLGQCQVRNAERIETFHVECGNALEVRRWSEGRRFDVIVDDGCHNPLVQAAVWANLWPLINPGGVYVLEDIENITYPDNSKSFEHYFGAKIYDLRLGPKKRHDDILAVWKKI